VDASLPLLDPPPWAVLERHLFAALDQSVEPFLKKYTRPDGTLVSRDTLPGRDGQMFVLEADPLGVRANRAGLDSWTRLPCVPLLACAQRSRIASDWRGGFTQADGPAALPRRAHGRSGT
jgi:hypothetical protein